MNLRDIGHKLKLVIDELGISIKDFSLLVQVPVEKIETILSGSRDVHITVAESYRLFYFTDIQVDEWIDKETIKLDIL